MSERARPRIQRVGWENGLSVEAGHLRAADEMVETYARWALAMLPGRHGVLFADDSGKTFDVAQDVAPGKLWVEVKQLCALSRDGDIVHVEPADALRREHELAQLQGHTAVDVFAVPSEIWKSNHGGPEEPGALQRRSVELSFVVPQTRNIEMLVRTGLKIARFEYRDGWRPVRDFIPWCTTIAAVPQLRAAVEQITGEARRMRDRCLERKPAPPPPPEPPKPPRRLPREEKGMVVKTTLEGWVNPASKGGRLAAVPEARPSLAPGGTMREELARSQFSAVALAAAAQALIARVQRPDMSPLELFSELRAFTGTCDCLRGEAPQEQMLAPMLEDELTTGIRQAVEAVRACAGRALSALGATP